MNLVLGSQELTLKNSPRTELYGLHGFPLTYFYTWSVIQTVSVSRQRTKSLVNQKRRTSNMRPTSLSARPMLRSYVSAYSASG